MARNGSGTYVVYTPGNPVVTGTTISSTAFNNTINDIATALTGSISADGQTPITANIPMNSHKLTGLGAPTVAGDALSYGGVVAGSTGAFTSSALGTQVIATNGGTTTLTSTSPYYTVFTGTFVQTLVLPDATTLTVGQQYGIDNDGSLAITVKTNGGATLWTIASGCDLYLTLTAQATAVGTWETDYQGAQLATGKTLVVNNSVTVNGTDGTTMTLPTVSGTLATLAGSETLTNKALNGSLGATTPSTVAATTINASGVSTLTGGATIGTGSNVLGLKIAYNTADVDRSSTTTLATLSDLTLSLGANETWIVEYLIYAGVNLEATGVKVSVSTPAASSSQDIFVRLVPELHDLVGGIYATPACSYYSDTSGNVFTYTAADIVYWSNGQFMISVRVSTTTAGNIIIQTAPETSTATNFAIRRGSYVKAQRVA